LTEHTGLDIDEDEKPEVDNVELDIDGRRLCNARVWNKGSIALHLHCL